MINEYNKSPISLVEGKVFIDGLEVMDCVSFSVTFTPKVWSGKQLGEQTDSSRWLGYDIAGNITRRRSTPFLKEIVKKYQSSRRTPELTIQGLMTDKNSDYFADFGSDVVTAVGCVLTGSISLLALDSKGEVVDDSIAFKAKDVV